MFHKRNPGAPFPGANTADDEPQGNQQSGQTVQASVSQAPANAYMPPRPAGVREYGYSRATSQNAAPQAAAQQPAQPRPMPAQAARPQSQTINQTISTPNTISVTTNSNNSNEGQTMSNPNENTANQATPSAPRPMDIPGTMPYGRPMAPGAMNFGAPAHNAAYNPYGSGRKLIIGEGITMSGEIEHCDHLIVEGTVQATLKEAKLLDISEAGVFYGTVDIEEATIAGRFEGDINVNGRLTVKATGVITGSIRYKELAVEAGASIEGSLSPVGPRKGDDNVAAADFSKGKAVAKQAREAAQKSGEQLPFGDKTAAAQ